MTAGSYRSLLRRVTLLAVPLGVAFAPTLAHADDDVAARPILAVPPSPPDWVYLRDGGLVRGRIQEILPGHHVTVILDTGEARIVPWPNVDRVIVASAATIPPLATPEPAVAPPPPPMVVPVPPVAVAPPMDGPLVHVRVVTPHATLIRIRPHTVDFIPVCTGPCEADVPLGDNYRLRVWSNTSNAFRLQPGGGPVDLEIVPPSTSGTVIGSTLIAGGGITAYLGLLAAAPCAVGQTSCTGSVSAMVGGAGAVVLGIIVLTSSLSTDVNQHSGAFVPPQGGAFVREPTWRTPSSLEAAAGPGAMTTPLYSVRF